MMAEDAVSGRKNHTPSQRGQEAGLTGTISCAALLTPFPITDDHNLYQASAVPASVMISKLFLQCLGWNP